MNIKLVSGCVHHYYEIDGKLLNDYSLNEQIEIYKKIYKKFVREYTVDDRIDSLLDHICYDDYECDNEPCEQCGDTVCTTVWEL